MTRILRGFVAPTPVAGAGEDVQRLRVEVEANINRVRIESNAACQHDDRKNAGGFLIAEVIATHKFVSEKLSLPRIAKPGLPNIDPRSRPGPFVRGPSGCLSAYPVDIESRLI
jgi:hypothetical protein